MSLLSDYLRTRCFPWSLDQGKQRFIVAGPVMPQLQLPEGVKLVEREIVGQRIIVRNRRFWDNVRTHSAAWPQAGLDEWENYKMICVLQGRADIQLGNYVVQCNVIEHGRGGIAVGEPGDGLDAAANNLRITNNVIEGLGDTVE